MGQNEFKIETGQLSVGTIFRVFKSGEELIDPTSSKSLGKLLTFIGNLKTREVSGGKGKGDMLFSTGSINNGDVLLANSDKNLTKGTIIVQPGEQVAESQLPSKLEAVPSVKAEAVKTAIKAEDKVQVAVDGALVKASPLARRSTRRRATRWRWHSMPAILSLWRGRFGQDCQTFA